MDCLGINWGAFSPVERRPNAAAMSSAPAANKGRMGTFGLSRANKSKVTNGRTPATNKAAMLHTINETSAG